MRQSNGVLLSDILMAEAQLCESPAISKHKELAISMTFQVAMLSRPPSDNWVLASDTKVLKGSPIKLLDGSPRVVPDYEVTTMLETRKIISRQDLGLVYAIYGNDQKARFAGLELEKETHHCISEENARLALIEVNRKANDKFPHVDGGLLAIFFYMKPALWALEFEKGLMPMTAFAFGGGGNLAMYLPQRFYRLVVATKDFQKLKMLAALTVLEGHHCNPSVVEGLEMCWSENGEPPHHATREEIAELTAKSETLVNAIVGLF
jgi:hypothetical protein